LAALVIVLATLVPQRDDGVLLPTHQMVTWVSLKLSGRSQPYTRADLHRMRAGSNAQPTLR
jgi:hypothetical protein